jgi:hypothetical protein
MPSNTTTDQFLEYQSAVTVLVWCAFKGLSYIPSHKGRPVPQFPKISPWKEMHIPSPVKRRQYLAEVLSYRNYDSFPSPFKFVYLDLKLSRAYSALLHIWWRHCAPSCLSILIKPILEDLSNRKSVRLIFTYIFEMVAHWYMIEPSW